VPTWYEHIVEFLSTQQLPKEIVQKWEA
jgi:hypothetical protein